MFPELSPGTITVGGLNLMSGSTLKFELGAIRDRIVVTNNGNVTFGGRARSLDPGWLRSRARARRSDLFEGAIGSITGTFSAVNAPIFNGQTLNVVYGVNQVTLQVGDANFLAADFDENGFVNGADLMRWKTNFGTGATHALGNADGDGDVDGADFLVWQRQLGGQQSLPSAPPVPEPGSLALAALALLGTVSWQIRVSTRFPA